MLGEGDREADPEGDAASARVAPRRAALAVGAVVGAVLLAAFVAAGDQVPLATEGERGWEFELPTIPDAGAAPIEPVPLEQQREDEISGIGTLGVLLQAGLILVAAVVFVISIRTVRTWQRTKPDRRAIIPDPPMAPIPDELVDAIDDGIEAMASGPVDDVIVECWVRLEEAAARAGVARDVSETSSELAGRVLTELHAPPDAVEALLVRYRTVRYSHHRLGEHDRTVALDALRELRAAIIASPA